MIAQLNATGSSSLNVAFGNKWTTGNIVADTLYELTLDHPTITLNGTPIGTVSNSTPSITSQVMPIVLFGLIGGERPSGTSFSLKGGYVAQFCNHKIYRFTLTEKSSGAVVADMRPAVRASDSAVGMYDIVRDIFFENARNTGTFVVGND